MNTDTIRWELIERFREVNPQVVPVKLAVAPLGKRWSGCGYYRTGTITVYPDNCTQPGRGYSWPGHVSDRTQTGVMAHEMGHHVHFTRPDWQQIEREFPIKGQAVTGYEPNPSESFAESFRLFFLNPTLLEEGRRRRYGFIVDLGFRPIEHRHWTEVLEGMPQRFLDRINNRWLSAGK